MSESRHSEIRLSLTEGTADKEYQAWLEQVDGHFHVDFAYGRRGTALKTGRKTASPLPLEEAAAVLARLVRSKEAKGYTRDASGAAYRATDLAGRVSGHAVQLLNPIEEADLEALLVSTQRSGRSINERPIAGKRSRLGITVSSNSSSSSSQAGAASPSIRKRSIFSRLRAKFALSLTAIGAEARPATLSVPSWPNAGA